jgi:radical SAM superfamily enzyme YgiQ (UPF0313 family)
MSFLPPRKMIFFADDNLTVSHRRTVELCRRMVERDIRRRYAIQGELGLAAEDEVLHWLKRSGCLFTFIGFESLSSEALVHIGKPDLLRAGVGGYERLVARIHAHGLAVFGSFIVGFDEDTPATFDEIRDFVLSTGIDSAIICILHPVPGTPVWERLQAQDRLLYTDFPDDYALYVQNNVCFRPARMTPVELQEGTRQLILSLNRPMVALRRAWATWRRTRDPQTTLVCFGWNWRTFRSLRSFPLRDVRLNAQGERSPIEPVSR